MATELFLILDLLPNFGRVGLNRFLIKVYACMACMQQK